MSRSILDDAENRIAASAATAQVTQTEIVDAMRLEMKPERYQRAKVELLKLESFIAKDSRPFMERLATIRKRANKPLPPNVQDWLNEMTKLCDSVPYTVREGIKGWDMLTPPLLPDGRSLDDAARAKRVHDITVWLINWDGVQERLQMLKGQIEHFITISGWPASPPPVAA